MRLFVDWQGERACEQGEEESSSLTRFVPARTTGMTSEDQDASPHRPSVLRADEGENEGLPGREVPRRLSCSPHGADSAGRKDRDGEQAVPSSSTRQAPLQSSSPSDSCVQRGQRRPSEGERRGGAPNPLCRPLLLRSLPQGLTPTIVAAVPTPASPID